MQKYLACARLRYRNILDLTPTPDLPQYHIEINFTALCLRLLVNNSYKNQVPIQYIQVQSYTPTKVSRVKSPLVVFADMTDIFVMYYAILVPAMEKRLPFLQQLCYFSEYLNYSCYQIRKYN